MPPILRDDAQAELGSYRPVDPGQWKLREELLGVLVFAPDATDRGRRDGHVTASTVVLDSSLDRVLLTHHRKLGRWLQFGGHCEAGDATIAAVARREAIEESGIAGLRLVAGLIDVDIHPLDCPAGHRNRHFDLRFAALAPSGSEPQALSESLEVGWFALDRLPDDADPSVTRAIRAARQALDNDHPLWWDGSVGTA